MVQYRGGVEMTNFTSKSLEQTFDRILFVTRIQKAQASKLEKFDEVPADTVHQQYAEQTPAQTATAPKKGDLKKAENGRSIEEIYADPEALKDTQVVVTARVMKVSTHILGKNWLTLEDGTGQAPQNKLTVTTQDLPSVGDDVTLRGIVKTNVDLGAGYIYKVLIEEASLVK
jgi:hypothetical protein